MKNVISKAATSVKLQVVKLFKQTDNNAPSLWKPEEIEEFIYAYALEAVGLNPPAGVAVIDYVLTVQGFDQNKEGLWSRPADTYTDIEGVEKRAQYTYESALNIAAGEVVQGKPRAHQLKLGGDE